MDKIIFIEIDQIKRMHREQIEAFGGIHGIRDHGLLESALNMPLFGFSDAYAHKDIFEMAAAYAYHLIKNHPFIDGNKRIGVLAVLVFLILNQAPLDIENDLLFALGIGVASSKLSKEKIAQIFRQHCKIH